MQPSKENRQERNLCHLANLAQSLERAQTESQTLAPAAYPHEASDRPVLALLLNAQIGQSILACDNSVSSRFMVLFVISEFENLPNTERAYKFALKNWQSPLRLASGVRHSMFVTFMRRARKSLRPLPDWSLVLMLSWDDFLALGAMVLSVVGNEKGEWVVDGRES